MSVSTRLTSQVNKAGLCLTVRLKLLMMQLFNTFWCEEMLGVDLYLCISVSFNRKKLFWPHVQKSTTGPVRYGSLTFPMSNQLVPFQDWICSMRLHVWSVFVENHCQLNRNNDPDASCCFCFLGIVFGFGFYSPQNKWNKSSFGGTLGAQSEVVCVCP